MRNILLSDNPMIDLLLTRRSVKPLTMTGPGPSDAELQTILRVGARVPDHGKLAPWRFILFKDAARGEFGKVLRDRLAEIDPAANEDRLAMELGRFERAPVVITVVSRVVESRKAPDWEQHLSAGASCQNILVAATALGFASCWLTEWCAFDEGISQALGLAENERVAGFIYLGRPTVPSDERPRPDLNDICSEWLPR